MADNFGLSNLRDGLSEKAEELRHGENIDSRSYDDAGRSDDGPFKPFTFQQEDFDRTEPDKDAMRKYWRHYETVPFVRKSISSFARQVMEPGYYIKAQGLDEEQLRKLDHWLTSSAVIEGQKGKDFRQLAKKMVVQMEVRGTSFAELAPDSNDPDKIAGMKLINAETMEAVTRPGQSILLEPDDIDEYDGAPEAESGGAAAWLQDLGETETFFATPISGRNRGVGEDNDENDDFKIGFQRDEIVVMTRDADAGEVFGTSRLEAVSDRIEGLRQKLCDNDDAIASKAYPLWLFKFGSEENPWDSDDINEFMRAHEMENFHAGMKQGVRGDVTVDTVSGEVAEIADALNFDVEWIMSIMPIPGMMLGAFTSDDAATQAGAMFQQQEVQRQIKDVRRDIEDEFTPVLRDVAKQMGMPEESAETIRLKVGDPGEPEPEVTPRENIIRYVPEDQREPSSGDDGGWPEITGEEPQQPTESPGNDGVPSEAPAEAGAQAWHSDTGIAELSMSEDSQLADTIYETMLATKEQVLNEVSRRYGDKPNFAAANFETVANSVLKQQLSRGQFRDSVEPVVSEHLDDFGQDSFSHSNNVRFFVQNVENSTEDALEEMLRLMRIQVRRGANQDESWESIQSRVEREYDDANLRQRAELIAHMELQNATENSKLQQFESDPEVIGVRVVNENPSTPLTQSLAGAELYFDDGDLRDQLESHTRDEFLHEGFDPLPTTPPFHFSDTTTFEPIYE